MNMSNKVTVKGITYTKEVIQDKLRNDVRWIERAVVTLYGYQTQEEQQVQGTIDSNGRGFNGQDGTILTSFGNQLSRGRHLTEKQLEICKKKLPKYWKQILITIEKKN